MSKQKSTGITVDLYVDGGLALNRAKAQFRAGDALTDTMLPGTDLGVESKEYKPVIELLEQLRVHGADFYFVSGIDNGVAGQLVEKWGELDREQKTIKELYNTIYQATSAIERLDVAIPKAMDAERALAGVLEEKQAEAKASESAKSAAVAKLKECAIAIQETAKEINDLQKNVDDSLKTYGNQKHSSEQFKAAANAVKDIKNAAKKTSIASQKELLAEFLGVTTREFDDSGYKSHLNQNFEALLRREARLIDLKEESKKLANEAQTTGRADVEVRKSLAEVQGEVDTNKALLTRLTQERKESVTKQSVAEKCVTEKRKLESKLQREVNILKAAQRENKRLEATDAEKSKADMEALCAKAGVSFKVVDGKAFSKASGLKVALTGGYDVSLTRAQAGRGDDQNISILVTNDQDRKVRIERSQTFRNNMLLDPSSEDSKQQVVKQVRRVETALGKALSKNGGEAVDVEKAPESVREMIREAAKTMGKLKVVQGPAGGTFVTIPKVDGVDMLPNVIDATVEVKGGRALLLGANPEMGVKMLIDEYERQRGVAASNEMSRLSDATKCQLKESGLDALKGIKVQVADNDNRDLAEVIAQANERMGEAHKIEVLKGPHGALLLQVRPLSGVIPSAAQAFGAAARGVAGALGVCAAAPKDGVVLPACSTGLNTIMGADGKSAFVQCNTRDGMRAVMHLTEATGEQVAKYLSSHVLNSTQRGNQALPYMSVA